MAIAGVHRRRGGGRISVRGQGGRPVAHIRIEILGVERTTDEFKRIRRQANVAMRDAQQRVGEREVLPIVKARFPRRRTSDGRGLPVGAMAASLYVKRDRLDVFIGSRLRGPLNRALGWIDFGGQRPRDRSWRAGPRTIIGTLTERQPQIRAAITDAVLDEFAKHFDVS